jgi:hypothetical protein
VTHLAGEPICIADRYCRQRCAWCGEILIDMDLTTIMVPIDQADKGPAAWPVGSWVRVDGPASFLVEGPRPDDSCATLEITR